MNFFKQKYKNKGNQAFLSSKSGVEPFWRERKRGQELFYHVKLLYRIRFNWYLILLTVDQNGLCIFNILQMLKVIM